MYRRIAKTVLALLLGSGQEVLFQVLSALVWISCWGAEAYSEWLLIALLPTLLMRGNTGLFHCASSQLIRDFEASAWQAARYSLDTLLLGQRWFLLLIAVVYVAVAMALAGAMNLATLAATDVIAATALFIAQFALFQRHQTLLSLAKAAAQAPRAVMWQNGFRAAFIAPMLVVAFWYGPIPCLLVAVIGQLAVVVAAERRLGELRQALPAAGAVPERRDVVALIRQGLGFSAFGFGQTLLHNAAVWSLGFVAGPLVGAAFHNMRTIARSVVLLAMALEQATRLELSRLFASNRVGAARRLLSRMLTGASLSAGAAALAIVAIGPWAFALMTRGRLEFDLTAFLWLCGAALLFSVAFLYLSLAFALNRHVRLSVRYFVIVVASLPLIGAGAVAGPVVVAAVALVADAVFLFMARSNAQAVLRTEQVAAHAV